MKKKLLMLLVVLVLLFTGCGGKEVESDNTSGEEEKKIEIGMSFDSFVIERWQRDRDVFVSTAKELGANVNVQNANGDVDKQIEQIDYFVKKNVDVIVIISVDCDSISDSIKKAKDAGIKVIAYDRLCMNSDVDLYISFDNEMVGMLMAQSLADNGAVGGNVLMLGGSPSDNNVKMVEEGFRKVCEANNMTIIDSMHCNGWKAELAADYIYENESILSDTDAIMCGNDNLAGQVIRALSEKRLAGTIPIVGQDGDLEACQKIVEGTQTMTVFKPVEKLAKKAAECAIALAKGDSLDENAISSINDGTYEVPYIGLEPIAVTKENMDEVIIESNFHLKEEVYLNTTK